MDSVTVEDWDEEIFAEGVGVKWRKWAGGRRGSGRKNTLARSLAKPVHQIDGGSDWCGRLQFN